MKHWDLPKAMLRNVKLVIGLALMLSLVGCSLGEAVMPNPPPGVAADRSAGIVVPVPAATLSGWHRPSPPPHRPRSLMKSRIVAIAWYATS
jgi:hypothetical protein